jgi:preprotein translocase subunit SecD
VEYRFLYPKDYAGNRVEATGKTVLVLTRRLLSSGLKQFKVTARGTDGVMVEFKGVTSEEFERCKGLLALCNLELREVAPLPHRRSWKPGDAAPEGFESVENDADPGEEGEHLGGGRILVGKEAIVAGADVDSSSALPGDGQQWRVEFTLTESGGRKLDLAAERLFNQSPKGRIAIVKDGRVLSKPTVQAPRIGVRVQVAGSFTRQQAEDLAVVLRNGSLPVPIGRVVDGRPEPGVPESETHVDLAPGAVSR